MLGPKDKWDSHHDSHAPEVVRPLQPKRPSPVQQDQIVTPPSDSTPKSDRPAVQQPRDPESKTSPPSTGRDLRNGIVHPEAKAHTDKSPPARSPPISRPSDGSKERNNAAAKVIAAAFVVISAIVLLIRAAGPNTQVVAPQSQVVQARPVVRPDVSPQPNPPRIATARSEAGTPTNPKPVVRTTGSLRVSAFTVDKEANRHEVSSPMRLTLEHVSSTFVLATNTSVPCLWHRLPAGEHRVEMVIDGYEPVSDLLAQVPANTTGHLAVAMQPKMAVVKFLLPSNRAPFSVYYNSRRIGASDISYRFEPFVRHVVTFKSPGWRDKAVALRFNKPGAAYSHPIKPDRVSSGMRIAVVSDRDDPPKAGKLSFGGRPPIDTALPYERLNIHSTGTLSIVLSAPGYQIRNNPQVAILRDGEVTNIAFRVVKESWVRRLLSGSTKADK